VVMFIVWKLVKRTRFVHVRQMDLITDRYDLQADYKERTTSTGRGHAGKIKKRWQLRVEEGDENTWHGRLKRFGMWLFF
jgi:amino acid transporter, AAT family